MNLASVALEGGAITTIYDTRPERAAQFDAMPRAIAPRKADIAVAFLDELKLVPK